MDLESTFEAFTEQNQNITEILSCDIDIDIDENMPESNDNTDEEWLRLDFLDDDIMLEQNISGVEQQELLNNMTNEGHKN
jgi:hypothetical protein